MNYCILNINELGQNKVKYWLEERQIAPIFYGQDTIAQISERGTKDAKLFVNTFNSGNKDNIVISIGDEYIYIYRQVGTLQEYGLHTSSNKKEKVESLLKGFQIQIIKKIPIKTTPLVLASIKSNLFFSLGTFKIIPNNDKYIGNIQAINFLLNEEKIIKVSSFKNYLYCLSSLEFETFIAKLLEEKGLFVPAYKGGFLKDFDLFCKNITDKEILIRDITIQKNATISVQLKLTLDEDIAGRVDIIFCISTQKHKANNVFDETDIHYMLQTTPNTLKWLRQTLYWVEYSF